MPEATTAPTTTASTTAEIVNTTAEVTKATSESTTLPVATTTETSSTTIAPETTTVETTTVAPPVQPEVSTFNIHFIDVGQADAALVECDGHYMLIDGGNKADSDIIYTVLKRNNITHLDIVVGTHAHEDHIGGIPGAFNFATSDLTLCPVKSYDTKVFEDFAKYANQKGGGITVPSVGDEYALGSAKIAIVGVNGSDDTNDTSIVLRIDYGATSFLFTGDAERDAEQKILNSGYDIGVDVLKIGHHGSDTSTTYPFLREILPEYAVISVGEGNSYGHPTEDTLSRLRDADVKVFRTDLQGDIFCTSDGEKVSFTVSKNADADVFGNIGQNSTQQTEATETEPEETTSTATEKQETMVWIPKSGSKYHSYAGCSNMKNPSQVTEATAKSRGYEPCKKCW